MSFSRLPGLLASVAVGAMLWLQQLHAATTNALPGFPRPANRTNAAPRLPGFPAPGVKTNPPPSLAGGRVLTNTPGKAASTNLTSRASQTFQRWKSSPAFYSVAGAAAL